MCLGDVVFRRTQRPFRKVLFIQSREELARGFPGLVVEEQNELLLEPLLLFFAPFGMRRLQYCQRVSNLYALRAVRERTGCEHLEMRAIR